MKRFEAKATIARPPATVWAYAADIERHPAWMSVEDARLISGNGTTPGGRGRERLLFGPFKLDVDLVVAEAEPGRRLVWASDDPRFDITVTLDLAPTAAGTTDATYTSAVELHGRWRLVSPLLSMDGPRAVQGELDRLKTRVEATLPVAAETPA